MMKSLYTTAHHIFDCELCSRSPRNYFCDDDDDDDDDDEGTFLKSLPQSAKKGLIRLFV